MEPLIHDVIRELDLSILDEISESDNNNFVAAINLDNNLELLQPPVAICFLRGTPVATDQGDIAIEKLNTDKHTIHNKRIVAITKTTTIDNYLISIEKCALGNNVPCATTQISKNHMVFYKGNMVKAKDLIKLCDGVKQIPYNGETLYNVLMEEHNNMMVNNLICETLDPTNIMAKICGGKYDINEQNELCNQITEIFKRRDEQAYRKLYFKLNEQNELYNKMTKRFKQRNVRAYIKMNFGLK